MPSRRTPAGTVATAGRADRRTGTVRQPSQHAAVGQEPGQDAERSPGVWADGRSEDPGCAILGHAGSMVESSARRPDPRPRRCGRRCGNQVMVVGVASTGGRSPRRPRCAACRPRRRRPALQRAVDRGQADGRRDRRAGRGSPGRCGSRRTTPALGDRAPLPGRAQRPGVSRRLSARHSALRGRVPVAVVDVVDVVAVGDGEWPQSWPCSWVCSSIVLGCSCRARSPANGGAQRRAAAQPDADRPGTTKPASASSTMSGRARRSAGADANADSPRPPTEASMPSPIAASSVRAERAGELLGGGDRHDHERGDEQQPDGAHRDRHGDGGEHGDQQVVDRAREAGDLRELLRPGRPRRAAARARRRRTITTRRAPS